jgi:hypothetical protein
MTAIESHSTPVAALIEAPQETDLIMLGSHGCRASSSSTRFYRRDAMTLTELDAPLVARSLGA